jgi:hypothetical protein
VFTAKTHNMLYAMLCATIFLHNSSRPMLLDLEGTVTLGRPPLKKPAKCCKVGIAPLVRSHRLIAQVEVSPAPNHATLQVHLERVLAMELQHGATEGLRVHLCIPEAWTAVDTPLTNRVHVMHRDTSTTQFRTVRLQEPSLELHQVGPGYMWRDV